MFRCYCNQCENGGYVEPNYGAVEEPAEFRDDFVGPSQLLVADGEFDDFIPF